MIDFMAFGRGGNSSSGGFSSLWNAKYSSGDFHIPLMILKIIPMSIIFPPRGTLDQKILENSNE